MGGKTKKPHTGREDCYPTVLELEYGSLRLYMRLFCSLYLRMFRKTKIRKELGTLKNWTKRLCDPKKSSGNALTPLLLLSPKKRCKGILHIV